MRRQTILPCVLGTALFSITLTLSSVAQNPTMTEQQRDADREQIFGQFQDFRRMPTSEQQRKAYEVAKIYLLRFGGEENADTKTVRKFVADYERASKESELIAAYIAKNYKKAFEIGRQSLTKDPENFFILATLTEAGFQNAQAGNAELNADTVGYARSAIKILETNQKTDPRPFKTLGAAQGFLNFTLGWLLKDQEPVEAAAALTKSLQADSSYKTDPAAYRLLGVIILKGEFTKLTAEYNEKFGNKPPSAEQGAMLQRIMHLGDRAIDAYARAVALSTAPEQQQARAKMMAQLTALYKNLHNDSDVGLTELLATVLSKPIPSM